MTCGPSLDDSVELLRPVGCVHERDVVAVFIQRLGEDYSVPFENSAALFLAERRHVGLERVERLRTVFHKVHRGGSSRQRLQPQGSRAREEIQHPRAIEVVLQTSEPAVPHVLWGGPNSLGRGGEVPTRVFSADDAHGP